MKQVLFLIVPWEHCPKASQTSKVQSNPSSGTRIALPARRIGRAGVILACDRCTFQVADDIRAAIEVVTIQAIALYTLVSVATGRSVFFGAPFVSRFGAAGFAFTARLCLSDFVAATIDQAMGCIYTRFANSREGRYRMCKGDRPQDHSLVRSWAADQSSGSRSGLHKRQEFSGFLASLA